MTDRFTRGFIAGVAGSVVKNLINLGLVHLNLSTLRYLDFASVILHGDKPDNTGMAIFFFFVELIWAGALGVFIAYLVPNLRAKNYVYKTAFVTVAAWFIFYTTVTLFEVPIVGETTLGTAISQLLTSLLAGLVYAIVSRWLAPTESEGSLMRFTLHDRFAKGFVAGISAGIAFTAINLSSYSLGFAKNRFLDFIGTLALGSPPETLGEQMFSQAIVLVLLGSLGVVFSYLLPQLNEENYLLKGWLFSVIFWFSIYSIGTLFRTPTLYKIPWQTGITNFIAATVFGPLMAWTIYLLDQKYLDNHGETENV